MKIPGRKSQPKAPEAAKGGRPGGGPRIQKMQNEIEALRSRLAALEAEVQENRQFNKRLAEITDVVSEVLLPAEQRDDERLHAILKKYESAI
ncbi:MAG: DUF6752 domain-containing protein [Nocardioidaceae bacterium]